MSERQRNPTAAVSTPWTLDSGTGHPVLHWGVGADIHGGIEARSAGLGPGVGGISRSRTRRSRRSGIARGRNYRSPRWYRIVTISASGFSGIAVAVIAVVKGAVG